VVALGITGEMRERERLSTTVVYNTLQYLVLRQKLLAVCSDNAANNLTLVEHLLERLSTEFDDEHDDLYSNLKDLMHFKGKKSHIRCLGHVLDLVVKVILADLKTGTMKEALDEVDTPSSAIAKLRHIVVWILG
jgi:hypothetical protein